MALLCKSDTWYDVLRIAIRCLQYVLCILRCEAMCHSQWCDVKSKHDVDSHITSLNGHITY